MMNCIKPLLSVLAILLFGTSFMTGCASKKPTHIELVITSDKELNYDKDNVSSPLMLMFYELESAERFSKLNYWDIIEKSGAKLNQDLISQTKHVITPNQEHNYKIVFDKRTKFLGILGKFRDIKNSNWRYVINLEENDYNFKELKVEKYTIMDDE